jgi:S1-C subfamily serine protease
MSFRDPYEPAEPDQPAPPTRPTSPTPSTGAPSTTTGNRNGLSVRTFAALAAASLLGGGVALGGAAAIGAFDEPATSVAVTTGAGAVPAAGGALSVNLIYKRSGPGVVQITSTSDGGGRGGQQALGSGFVIDKDGHVVTNYHVVQGATEVEVRFSNDDTLKASIVGSDPSTDLALLKVDAAPSALTPLLLADSEQVQVGDAVVAIGNPFGLERTVTAGIVSALQRNVTAPNGFQIDHVIQTDAPINSGNSGGPLLDARGDVIGVNSQIQTGGSGNGNVGIGFAVPSNTVKSVVAQLLESGKVEHAYLGVAARSVDPELAQALGLPVDAGLLIEEVTPGSGAAKAKLQGGDDQTVVAGESYRAGGDVIVAADGERVSTIDDLRRVIAAHKPGDEIELKLYRGDEQRTVVVTLGLQPTSLSG